MGRKSTKENKNIYQQMREAAGLTREKAGEIMEFVSADRVEKIESDKSLPHPDEILRMAECYKAPELVNHFCSRECPIGAIYVPEVKVKSLSQIVLETLATMNNLNRERERLIEITSDGIISEDELEDFNRIREQLSSIASSASALQLWIDKYVADRSE